MRYKILIIGILIGAFISVALSVGAAMDLWKYTSSRLQPVSSWNIYAPKNLSVGKTLTVTNQSSFASTSMATTTISKDLIFNTNTLYGNSITHRIGFATSSPRYLMDVWGSASFGTSTVNSMTPLLYINSNTGKVSIATTTIAGSLALGNALTYTATFSGYGAAGATSTTITGLSGNNVVVRSVQLYMSTDPLVNSTSTLSRLSFYNCPAMTENCLIKAFYPFLTYTNLNGGVTAGWSTSTVYSSAGLVKYDLVRFMGGTAENQRINDDVDSATSVTTTVYQYTHANATGLVRVAEINQLWQAYDASNTNQIYSKLETFEDSFQTPVSFYLILNTQ